MRNFQNLRNFSDFEKLFRFDKLFRYRETFQILRQFSDFPIINFISFIQILDFETIEFSYFETVFRFWNSFRLRQFSDFQTVSYSNSFLLSISTRKKSLEISIFKWPAKKH